MDARAAAHSNVSSQIPLSGTTPNNAFPSQLTVLCFQAKMAGLSLAHYLARHGRDPIASAEVIDTLTGDLKLNIVPPSSRSQTAPSTLRIDSAAAGSSGSGDALLLDSARSTLTPPGSAGAG